MRWSLPYQKSFCLLTFKTSHLKILSQSAAPVQHVTLLHQLYESSGWKIMKDERKLGTDIKFINELFIYLVVNVNLVTMWTSSGIQSTGCQPKWSSGLMPACFLGLCLQTSLMLLYWLGALLPGKRRSGSVATWMFPCQIFNSCYV